MEQGLRTISLKICTWDGGLSPLHFDICCIDTLVEPETGAPLHHPLTLLSFSHSICFLTKDTCVHTVYLHGHFITCIVYCTSRYRLNHLQFRFMCLEVMILNIWYPWGQISLKKKNNPTSAFSPVHHNHIVNIETLLITYSLYLPCPVQ